MGKELNDHVLNLRLKFTLSHSTFHQRDPSISSPLINLKWCMSQSQFRMPSMLQVILRAPKTKNQKHAEAFFCPLKIILGVHGPKNIIVRYLLIERSNEAFNSLRTNGRVNVVFCESGAVGGGLVRQRSSPEFSQHVFTR